MKTITTITVGLITAILFTPTWAQSSLPGLDPFNVLNPKKYKMPVKPVEIEPPNTLKVVADFTASVEQNSSLSQQLRNKIISMLQAEKPSDNPDMITDALLVSNNKFRLASQALGDEQTTQAVTLFKELAQSDDPFLAAHAIYFQARAYVQTEDFEAAAPLLKKVINAKYLDKTLYSGDALFMLGICQAELLDRDLAIETLKAFAIKYPNSSERQVIGALHMIEELAAMEDGTLVDVTDRMDYSRRRLALERTEKVTQHEQKKIISILDKLIEEAEQKENCGGGGGGGGGGQGQGQGPAQANQQPDSPAQSSNVSPGDYKIGDLHKTHRGKASEVWGNRPQKEREEVLNAIKARFPDRYNELIKQYYRSMQEKNGSNE